MARHRIGSRFGLSTFFTRNQGSGRSSRAALRQAVIETLESRMLLSTSWFVATDGSNANPGTINAPFLTIQHAADVTAPGDTVEIRGGVYRETVTMRHSGTASKPITFEAYGNESVTIDGANLISNWKSSGAAVYTAPMSWNLGAGNNQVFVDGQMINEARWPNTSLDLSHPTLATASSGSYSNGSDTIRDTALTQPNGFWVGATMHITGGQQWVMRASLVTASGPGWVTFAYDQSSPYGMPTKGNHFYLTGNAAALDAPGEWYRASNGTLSLWSPGSANPTNQTIEVKARDYAFDLTQASYIKIQDVHIFAATIVTSTGSRDISVNHITAEYLSQFGGTATGWAQPSDSGIVLDGTGDSLTNSVIAYSAGDGVFVHGSGATVSNNLIHDVDYQAGESGGVRVQVGGVTVSHNTIYNCGRSGIVDRIGGDTITYNVIHDFGLQTTDCGGIYTFQASGDGAIFAFNTIYNGITGGYGGVGVYLDNNSSGFDVYNNITYNVNTGLKMNLNSADNMIVNNTFSGTNSSVARIPGVYNWNGTVIENNLFPESTSFGSGAKITHNITNKGYFANPGAGNFQLVAGSPAIGAGVRLAPFTNGFGNILPDDGALKFGATPFVDGAVASALPPDPSQSHVPPIVSSSPATSLILAVNFHATNGAETARDGGLGNIFAGDWIEYAKVNFGTGVGHVKFQLAVTNQFAGQKIALHLDSPTGPTIGTLVTTGTGSWTTYAPQSTKITGASGIHNLYLVMLGTGVVANVQSFQFSA